MKVFTSFASSGIVLTVAIVFLFSHFNFMIINAQQQASQLGQIEHEIVSTAAEAVFQSANDSFSIQVPQGWLIQDINNTGAALSEETRAGYGLLAQLCPEEEQEPQQSRTISSNTSRDIRNNTSSNEACQTAQEVVHVIRYPDLVTRIQPANNITAYHLEKLGEVGYNNIQIVNSTILTVNVTNPLTNETVRTELAKFVEMTYNTASNPTEAKRGYFILTATNVTAPNLGVTKGFAVFYEGNSTTTNATAAITSISDNLQPSTLVGQVLGSFELIVLPETAQALTEPPYVPPLVGQTPIEPPYVPPEEEEDSMCHSSYPDVCIPPPPPNLNCDDVNVTNFEVAASDPHDFDEDNNGIGCESRINASDNSQGP